MFNDNPNDPRPPEKPRVEPEILPPDRTGRQSDWRRPPWRDPFGEARGTQRIFVTRVGPFGIALLLLGIAAVAAIILIAVLGAVLIWIPVVAVLVVIAAIFRFLHR
jgi:hypothetical protein